LELAKTVQITIFEILYQTIYTRKIE